MNTTGPRKTIPAYRAILIVLLTLASTLQAATKEVAQSRAEELVAMGEIGTRAAVSLLLELKDATTQEKELPDEG